jgi:predicted RecA/RadA family phage recombinase
MATNFIQKGDTLKYTNGTGSDIASGDIVKINSLVGVALVDIADGASGAVATEGVYQVDATSSAAISQGAAVYFDGTEMTPTAEDNTFVGFAWAAKAEAGTTVQVKLGGYAPLVNEVA